MPSTKNLNLPSSPAEKLPVPGELIERRIYTNEALAVTNVRYGHFR